MVQPERVGSHCTPVCALRRSSAGSSNGCVDLARSGPPAPNKEGLHSHNAWQVERPPARFVSESPLLVPTLFETSAR